VTQDQKHKSILTRDDQDKSQTNNLDMTSRRSSKNGKPCSTLEVSKNLVVSLEDLCRIIKVCAQNCVQEIRFGELHLVFGERDQSSNSRATIQTRSGEKKAQKINEEAQEHLRDEIVRDQLDQLKLLNPLEYERYMAGELVEDGRS